MPEVLLAIMTAAAALYAVLGGADFGVGLVEALIEPSERRRVDAALSPVWEANHVWLVLIAVLAFVGFPRLYTVVTTYLHVPLMLVLLGIVARGTAFTFRHYDPDTDNLRGVYSLVFRLASFLSPMFLGVIVATLASGTLHTSVERGFYATFIAPWNTWFAWCTGLFVSALFAFQGTALLAAEYADDRPSLPYMGIARRAHVATVLLGGVALAAGYFERVPFVTNISARPLTLTCMALATLLVPLVALAFHRAMPWTLRMLTGMQVMLVLVGYIAGQFPVLVRIAPHDVRFPDDAAPSSVLASLLFAVGVGLCAIVPGLGYLLKVYKGDAVR